MTNTTTGTGGAAGPRRPHRLRTGSRPRPPFARVPTLALAPALAPTLVVALPPPAPAAAHTCPSPPRA